MLAVTTAIGAVASVATSAVTVTRPHTALYDPGWLVEARAAVQAKAQWTMAPWAALVAEAEGWAGTPPLSVMEKEVVPPSGTKHSYISLDKYYWPCNRPPPPGGPTRTRTPDPTCTTGVRDNAVCCLKECGVCGGHGCADRPGGKPGCCLSNVEDSGRRCDNVGPPCVMNSSAPPCDQSTGLPYVRHDGYTNPEMELYDHDRLINMSSAIISLASAAYLGDRADFAQEAARLLRVWFLDAATAMEPNLDFGHFIPGVVNGSHGALIDTHAWAELLDAEAMLAATPSSPWTPADHAALQQWFREYLGWLRTSSNGMGEYNSTNNHGVWYDVQEIAVARFVGDITVSAAQFEARAAGRVALEIEPNGTLPAELARTKAWSYSQFALDAFVHVATLLGADSSEVLWDFESARGGSIRAAVDWQLQFVGAGAKPWPYPQIEPFGTNCTLSMVTQCVGGYYPILRRAAAAWPTAGGSQNGTYLRKASEVLADASASPFNLLLRRPSAT